MIITCANEQNRVDYLIRKFTIMSGRLAMAVAGQCWSVVRPTAMVTPTGANALIVRNVQFALGLGENY